MKKNGVPFILVLAFVLSYFVITEAKISHDSDNKVLTLKQLGGTSIDEDISEVDYLTPPPAYSDNNSDGLINNSKLSIHSKNSARVKENLKLAYEIGWIAWFDKVVNGEISDLSAEEFDSLIAIAIGLEKLSFVEKVTNYGFTIPEKSLAYIVNARTDNLDIIEKINHITNSGIVMNDQKWKHILKASLSFGYKDVAVYALQNIKEPNIEKQEFELIIDNGRSSSKEELRLLLESF